MSNAGQERKYLVSCTENEVTSLLAARIKEIVEDQKKRKIERPDEISSSQFTAVCNLLISGPELSEDTICHLAVKLATEGYGTFLGFASGRPCNLKLFPSPCN